MSRSLQVAPQHINRVKLARKRHGFPSIKAFATEMGITSTTASKFLNGHPVDYLNFVEFSNKLGLDWQGIVYIEPDTPPSTTDNPSATSATKSAANITPENIPLSGASQFIGRDDDLNQLHQLLQQNNQVAIAAVVGMGGVGKTELAIQYAKTHLNSYPGGICWLNPKQGDIGLQLTNFARVYLPSFTIPDGLEDLQAQVNFCWQHWYNPPDSIDAKVLLLLDDVTEYNQQIREFLKHKPGRFKVLITTREQLGKPIALLNLGVLKRLDAMKLLQSFVGRERVKSEPWVARKLCQWLGYLPLGLELVGRYLEQEPDLSLARMLKRLQEKRLKHPAFEVRSGMTAELGVRDAFELSWERLDENTRELGYRLSLFALTAIPWRLVAGEEETAEIEAARVALTRLHLLQRTDADTYRLHQLIREFFREKLEELDTPTTDRGGGLKRAFAAQMVLLAQQIPDSPTRDFIEAVTPAIPHLAEVAEHLVENLSDDDLVWPFVGLGRFYQGQGFYKQAAPWLEKCLELTKRLLGEAHPHVASSLNNLAGLYYSQGRYSEAEPLYLEALELTKRLLGEAHPHVATSLNNLASLYRSQGRYSEAEPLYLEALELTKRLLGEAHPHVATSLNNLAGLYKSQRRYSEAEPLYLEALELRKRLLGEAHPDVASSLNNLAGLYDSQRRYSEAEPLYLEALELRKRLLGEAHPDVATSLNNLASLYRSQGRYSEAEPLYLEALELYKRLLGEAHPDVATSLNNLAALYDSQRRYSEAEPLYLEALELYKRLLGEAHPKVATSLNNLAGLYDSQRRYSEAEPLYLEALELYKRLLGEAHPDVATSLNNLAELYKSQGRYSEAEPLYLEALELYKRLLGEAHPDVATSLNNLAELYKSQGRYSEAEPLYLEALELYKRLLGEAHPDVATSLNNLAELYKSQGRYSEAEPLYLEALEISRSQLGINHPQTVTIKENLTYFLREAINSDRFAELTQWDDPLVQEIIASILAEIEPSQDTTNE